MTPRMARTRRSGSGALRAARMLACLVVVTASAPAATTQPTTQPTVEEEALIQRLLRGGDDEGEAPAIERATEGMRASRVKLTMQFDTSDETQKIQEGVVRDLEEAIKEAWESQQKSPSTTTSKSDASDQQRRRKGEQTSSAQDASAQPAEANQPREKDGATRGKPTKGAPARGVLDELRRGWGRLPARDRDEVVQGFDQDYLRKYREWIERYYRALADPDRD